MANDCIKRLADKSNGAITIEQARDIISDVSALVKKKVERGMNEFDAAEEVIQERIENVTKNVAKEKFNHARNAQRLGQLQAKADSFIGQGASVKESFAALLEGINRPLDGARDSLSVVQERVKATYLSELVGRLEEANLLEAFNSKKMSGDIGRELWNQSKKMGRATENKTAHEIADIVKQIRDAQRARLNRAGAAIGEAEGYIMPQRHDAYAMHRAGKEAWVDSIEPLLDKDRTFGGEYDDFRSALESAYDAMVSGIRLDDVIVKDAKLFQFSGPANLAKKLSQQRKLHFRDFESWKKWNDNFGMRDINDGLLDAIASDSDNIGLIEMLGTNPEAMLNKLLENIKKKHRDKIIKSNEKGIDKKVGDLIDAALAKNMISADPKVAQIGSYIRAFNNVTMLGGAVISAITDIPLKSLEYKFQGKGWLESTVLPFIETAAIFKSAKDRARFQSMLGTYSESIVADIGGRFSAQDDLTRKTAKVQRLFFKANGLARWTDAHRFAMQRTMAHHLGMMKDVSYASLDADTKRMFSVYNITKKDWDLMRKAATRLDDGRDYILASKIDDLRVREKLTGYMIDRSDFGVLTPSAREQRLATMGTQRGTVVGEFTRLVMQFKSFPLTVITKVWGRALYGKGKADIPAMVYLSIMSATFGYTAMTMKDLLRNKTPRDPARLETIYAALAQGGGLGILGDVLLQDGSGFGRSLSGILAGPTAGRLDELFKIYSAAARGDIAEAQALRTTIGLIPGNNLFYLRAALDQIMLLELQEMVSPGYLKRMETNINKVYGQELLFQ